MLGNGPADDDVLDEDLLARICREDETAFQSLFARYYFRLRASGIRHGLSPESAEEVADDTLLEVAENACGFDPTKGMAGPWIRRRYFWRARSRRRTELQERQRLPTQPIDEEAEVSLPSSPSVETELEDHAEFARLEEYDRALERCDQLAFESLSEADQREIKLGRSRRGPVRDALKVALQRKVAAYTACIEHVHRDWSQDR